MITTQPLTIGEFISLEFRLETMSDQILLDTFKQGTYDIEYKRSLFQMQKMKTKKQHYIESLEEKLNYYNNDNVIKVTWNLIKNRLRRK